jgi:hypothetical protein
MFKGTPDYAAGQVEKANNLNHAHRLCCYGPSVKNLGGLNRSLLRNAKVL